MANRLPAMFFNWAQATETTVFEIINAFERATGVKLIMSGAPAESGDIEQVWVM